MFNSFFIDSADCKFVQSVLDVAKANGILENFAGVTTNPKILNRANINHTNFIESIDRLYRVIENYGEKRQLFIQIPSSTISLEELQEWLTNCVAKLDIVGQKERNLGIKIPPRESYIDYLFTETTYPINITGITHRQQLSALGDSVYCASYISFLFGRMEEIGLNPDQEIIDSYLNSDLFGCSRLIAGSLRNVSGLKRAFNLGMVPTIGTTAWEDIKNNLDIFVEMVKTDRNVTPDARAVNLSQEFFKEMDDISNNLNLRNAQ